MLQTTVILSLALLFMPSNNAFRDSNAQSKYAMNLLETLSKRHANSIFEHRFGGFNTAIIHLTIDNIGI